MINFRLLNRLGSGGLPLPIVWGVAIVAGAAGMRMANSIASPWVEEGNPLGWGLGVGAALAAVLGITMQKKQAVLANLGVRDGASVTLQQIKPVILAAAVDAITLYDDVRLGRFSCAALDPPDEHQIALDKTWLDTIKRAQMDRRGKKVLKAFVQAAVGHNEQMEFLNRYVNIRGVFWVPKGAEKRLEKQVKLLYSLAVQVRDLLDPEHSSE